jgi:hypothetical protein
MCIARVVASDPISLIAAESIVDCLPAGIAGGWRKFPYSRRVPAQHSTESRSKTDR